MLKKTEKKHEMPNNLSRYEVITILVIEGQQVAETFLDQTVLVFMIKDLKSGL